jgi:biofilm PGA synthesis N-glycosyltransferase PgaC
MWLALIFFGLYGVLLLLAANRWSNSKFNLESFSQTLPQSVSVVIAFRNEQQVLLALINSLRSIKYPAEKLEFLFINDHSTDDSMSILRRELDDFPFEHTIIEQSANLTGKKYAQLQGVKNAANEIVIATDADCVVSSNWVYEMQSGFGNKDIHFIAGNLTFIGSDFWSALLRIEMAPLLGVTGLAIEFSHPMLANGANMAFRKSSYLYVLEHRRDMGVRASGDDVFLLEAIKNVYGAKAIGFNKVNVIETTAPQSVTVFYNQRVRWASKWRANRSFFAAIPALAIWLFHLLFIALLVAGLLSFQWLLIIFLLLFKGIGEYFFIATVFKSYPYRMNLIAFILLTFFYSFYVIFFGLSGNFGRYKWKDRKYG